MDFFYFFRDLNAIKFNESDKIIYVPEKITNEYSLFSFYENELNVPSDYGKNWNAFNDNIGSLSFVNEKNIFIVHKDIPFSNDAENRRTYLEIIFGTVRQWWDFPDHKFYVYFPESCKEDVTRIIDSRTYE